MLKKIIHIKNLGLFKDASCTSPPFDKATLIYAENGRGKSTLASILRSCATGNTASISFRQSLDSHDAPQVNLLFSKGTSNTSAKFDKNTWSNRYPDILVFDAEFVDKNVYSGTTVNTNHRQGLLEFALGEDAVQLKQKVDTEAQKASEKAKEIKNIEQSLQRYRNEMSLKEFAELQLIVDVDQEINSLQKRLDAAKNNNYLQKKSCPTPLTNLQLDIEEFFGILATTIEDIEKDAEQTVRSHINQYSNENFEHWLSQGQVFEDEHNCPYCGQTLTNNDLLKAYKTHFNQAYQDLKSKVADLEQVIEQKLSDTIIDNLVSTVERNQSIADDWTEHVKLQRFELDKDKLLDIFRQIRDLFCQLVQTKQQNLLEAIGTDTEKEQAENLWNQAVSEVNTCDQSINISITTIENFKQQLASENIQQIEQKIKRLTIVKVRHEQTVCDLIQQWTNAKAARQSHEQEKEAARKQLDTLMTQTLQQYQTQINTLVRNFGALFEIDELSHDYRGTGLPRSNYGLKVKGKDVKLSADNAPSFSTALSEGDKRTLAFAFFIARIKADTNINSKIIVVDDPVCSLDRNRRNHTKKILRDIGRESAQLIVLGHDPHFLRDLRDDFQSSQVNMTVKLLKITRTTNHCSNFSTFDIDSECASSYYKNHKILQDFVNGGTVDNLYTVAQSIRPLLEGYLHRRFPGHVQRSKLFGQIIGEAKVAQLPNPLVYLQPLTTELYEINDYAGKFHHDTNAATDIACINESELRSYAERALTVIHKGSTL